MKSPNFKKVIPRSLQCNGKSRHRHFLYHIIQFPSKSFHIEVTEKPETANTASGVSKSSVCFISYIVKVTV